MSVFVTDGAQRSALAVVRALGSAGLAVTVGEETLSSLAGSSRYCSRRVCYPSPVSDPEAFRACLQAELAREPYRVLLPMTDITMQLVADSRDAFDPRVALPFPSARALVRCRDKAEVLALAARLGIACPRTWQPRDEDDLRQIAPQLSYPVILKPRFSRLAREGSWAVGSVEYASNAQDLVEKYLRVHAQIPCPLIQEKIEGEARGVFLLLWDGRVRAAFCHRRLREKPPWGGVSTLRESLPLDPELLRKCVALLQALEWIGVAMVEFKVDQRDGEAKLMEINGRFWGSLQLAIDAGLNFPLMLYRLALGETVPDQTAYTPQVKTRWFLGDLDSLLIRLRRRRFPDGQAQTLRSRLAALREFFQFHQPDVYNEIFRSDDPGPGWFELRKYLRDLLPAPRKEKAGAH